MDLESKVSPYSLVFTGELCSPLREREKKPPRLFIEAVVGLPCLSRALRSPSNGGSEGLEQLSL